MPIQDLAANLFSTATSPMIGFVDVQLTTTRELSLRMYFFLIEGIREADQVDGQRFVERFLEGPQAVWAGTDASIKSLPDMWSITRCADRFLPFLKWMVGWTSKLDFITDDLDATTLRRLIATSVPFWKIRGTEEALTEILQLTTAARTRVIDWFDLRYIADETSVGEVHEGHDSWMLELPGPPDHSENQINVRIVDDGTLNHQLVRNLARLTRPAGERITITYLGFLDLFLTDDDSSQWTNSAGSPPSVHDGSMFINAATDTLFANPSGSSSSNWRNYCASVTFRSASMLFSVYRTSDLDYYFVYYALGQLVLYSMVAGTPTQLAYAVTYYPDYPASIPTQITPDAWFPSNPIDETDVLTQTLRVQVTQENGQTRISVWLNGNFMVSALDSSHTQGSIGFVGGFIPDTFEIREVEMFFIPLVEDFIDIQGAS